MKNKEEEETLLAFNDNDLNQIPHGNLDVKKKIKKKNKKIYNKK